MNKIFRCGVGRSCITPVIGTILYGYAPGRPAESVNDDLQITAFAFSDGKELALLMTSDVCEMGSPEADEVRLAVSKATGVAFERIIFTCIHTHSAPVLIDTPGWGSTDKDYFKGIFLPAAISAAGKAVASVCDAVMGIAETESLVGINRRELMPDGNVRLGQSEWGPMDKTMTVISFKTVGGAPIGSIIHYSAHCTAAGCNPEVTRDWSGVMVDRLQSISGGVVAFFNGSIGDSGPRLTTGETVGNLKQALELGGIAASDAVRAYRKIKEYSAPDLKIVSDKISIPCAPVPSREATEARLRELGDPDKLMGETVLEYSKLRKRIATYDEGGAFEKEHSFPVTVISVGSVAFVPFAFEVFSETALMIRKYSPFAYTLVLSSANGTNFYLPTQDQMCRGGYEVNMFRIGNPFTLCDDADICFVREDLKLLKKLK